MKLHICSFVAGNFKTYRAHWKHQKSSFLVFSGDIKWEHLLLAESIIHSKFLSDILKHHLTRGFEGVLKREHWLEICLVTFVNDNLLIIEVSVIY